MLQAILHRVILIIMNIIMAIRSMFWKRDKSIILFGAWFGMRFADNSRFLYQHLSQNKKKYGLSHVVWVTRSDKVYKDISDLGYEVYMMNSEESIYFHKHAYFHIICNAAESYGELYPDILTAYSWRAIKINLWHGVIPMKGVSMASAAYLRAKNRHKLLYLIKEKLGDITFFRKLIQLPGGWGDCYYLSCTSAGTEMMMNFFGGKRNHYIEVSYPRFTTQTVFTKEERDIIKKIESYEKVILYLPTFRNGDNHFDYYEAWESIEEYLNENNYLWIQKLHSAANNRRKGINNNNIMDLSADFDINSIIQKIDVLITDYSSVTADAMIYNKPIIYYIPDYLDYANGQNGFLANHSEVMCGNKILEKEDLKDLVINICQKPFVVDENYLSVKKKYVGEPQSIDLIWQTISALGGI
ncbi:CDP-glycerol glycerophosphotransferase family protein [Butyrivibrio sp. VCD2006]|uniref:CDP-glycerol glycerophosphotransferase family protein n=1 Tax=Butyrivibrio sp. VCD2006 TaxID=1280664 RepID=UPI000408CD0D|nr:CDP-glycerol glycerophosphotransferase family protein [Butyrivibrio sp. VCD2006]